MTYTTMVYKAPSGEWSWSVLDDDRTPISSGAGYASEAEAEADADMELIEHDHREKSAAYWCHRFNTHADGYALIATEMKLSDLCRNMIDGAKASKHAATLRSEIELWERLVFAQPDPHAGLRADGEMLTGIDALDYPPDIAHPGNVDPDKPC